MITFGIIEMLSGERALIQKRLLKDRTIDIMCAYIFFVSGSFFLLLRYLPIYFQATRGVSAATSGVDNLPLILGASLFTIISSGLLTIWGRYIAILVAGSVLTIISSGLIYTLRIDPGAKSWIGYQAMAGIGLGLTFQTPIIVAQAIVNPVDTKHGIRDCLVLSDGRRRLLDLCGSNRFHQHYA